MVAGSQIPRQSLQQSCHHYVCTLLFGGFPPRHGKLVERGEAELRGPNRVFPDAGQWNGLGAKSGLIGAKLPSALSSQCSQCGQGMAWSLEK